MALTKEKIEYFKKKIEQRKKDLEEALSRVAKKNPGVPGDWEVFEDADSMTADKNEMADVFEDLENRKAIEDKLEEHLQYANEAIERIKNGTYGMCQTGGEPIEEERLEAFPCAKNCIKHAKNYK